MTVPGDPADVLVWERTRAETRGVVNAISWRGTPCRTRDKLRTLFVQNVPESVGEGGMEKILRAVGALRRWESSGSVLSSTKGVKFGFALYEDDDSIAQAAELLKEVEVPIKKQVPKDDIKEEADGEIEKTKIKFTVDPNTQRYVESLMESRGDEISTRLETAKTSLKQAIDGIFYPKNRDADGDTRMENGDGDNVEVVNIPLAQGRRAGRYPGRDERSGGWRNCLLSGSKHPPRHGAAAT